MQPVDRELFNMAYRSRNRFYYIPETLGTFYIPLVKHLFYSNDNSMLSWSATSRYTSPANMKYFFSEFFLPSTSPQRACRRTRCLIVTFIRHTVLNRRPSFLIQALSSERGPVLSLPKLFHSYVVEQALSPNNHLTFRLSKVRGQNRYCFSSLSRPSPAF